MKSFLKVLFYNVVIIAVLLALLDPFFKNNTIGQQEFRSQRNVILREYPPNIDTYKTPTEYALSRTNHLEKKPYRIRTNQHGFIIGEHTPKADSADIIFFGGSTTECLYVDENKRFPYLVGEKLSIYSNKKIVSMNGGVGGSHTLHSTINLLTKAISLQPETVVLMHNINDLALMCKTGEYWTAPETRSIIQKNRKPLSNKNFRGRISDFFKAGKDLVFPNIYRKIKIITNKPASKDIDEWRNYRNLKSYPYPDMERQFEQALLSFIRLARANGIEVVLMTQFNRLRTDDDFIRNVYTPQRKKQNVSYNDFCTYYKDFNTLIRKIAAEENILLIDLDQQIPANKEYIYDSVHLTEKGSEQVAEIIANTLQNQ